MGGAIVGVVPGGVGLYYKDRGIAGLPTRRQVEQPALVLIDVRCPLPGEQVTIRGQKSAIPFQQEMTVRHVAEPVVVTAPGREGRRFMIALDGPRRLWVVLPKGQGIRDATPQEVSEAFAHGAEFDSR